MKLTQADERAIRILARYGYVASVSRAGYWTVGPYRISQVTIRRILDAGYAVRDPNEPFSRILPTRKTLPYSEPGDDPSDGGDDDPFPDVGYLADVVDDGTVSLGWSPPDYRETDDRPIPVDRIIEKD